MYSSIFSFQEICVGPGRVPPLAFQGFPTGCRASQLRISCGQAALLVCRSCLVPLTPLWVSCRRPKCSSRGRTPASPHRLRVKQAYPVGFVVRVKILPARCVVMAHGSGRAIIPRSSKCGTYTTVKAIFWPWLLGNSPQTFEVVLAWLGSGTVLHRPVQACRQVLCPA